MIRRLILVALMMAISIGVPRAQLMTTGIGEGGAGSGASGGCTGVTLSFTTPCNSQYIVVIH